MQTKFELYQKVTSLARLGVWERNLSTGEVYWNDVVKDIYEIDESFNPEFETIIGLYLKQDQISELIDQATASGNTEDGNFQVITVRGNLKWVKLKVKADLQPDDTKLLYGTIEDITEQVNLRTILAEKEEQFRHAFDYAPIGMALVSPQGEWIRVNKTLCNMLGYNHTEFIKRTFQDITHPDDLDIDLQQMYQLLDNNVTGYNMDKRYYHKNGSTIWASLNVTLVRDQQQKPLYFVSQIIDISERIRQIDVISAQNSRLLNFAHIVSHNLRSHTGNIQMLSELIREETNTEEKDELIGMMAVSATNLQETLVHLNEVVDVQVGGNQKLKYLNLLDEINKTVGTLSGSLKIAGASLSVNADPNLEIYCDQAYLESILLNLLTNSIKYRNPICPLEINIEVQKTPDTVILQIQDNGLGIDLGLHGDKIFGMYKTFHGNADAHGIGLFLVKNQVEAMGGNVSVESIPGDGTIFKIEL